MIDYVVEMWVLASEGDKQGVIFFAALYTFVMAMYSSVFQLNVMKWPSTRGELQQAAVSKIGGTDLVTSEQEYIAKALYRYHVDGESFQGKRVSPWAISTSHNANFVLEKQMQGIHRYDDGSVQVFYNPKKPKKSFLIKPGKFGLAFTMLLAVLPLVLYVYAYLF